ncbi:MAG: hypothetical protein ACOC3C_06225 [Candidatus Thorarchaeota archaeon]
MMHRYERKEGNRMTRRGRLKTVFYFESCGEVNTEKTIELALERGKKLNIKTMVIASETGLSALKATRRCKGTDIRIVVATSPSGTKVESTPIGDLRIGIPKQDVRKDLLEAGVEIVQRTDPFFGIDAPMQEKGISTAGYIVRSVFSLIGSGVGVAVLAVMMATDAGDLKTGEEVVSVAGDWVGLSSAIVVEAANTREFLEQGPVIKEIICKPRDPRYSWPNLSGWKGNLTPYEGLC